MSPSDELNRKLIDYAESETRNCYNPIPMVKFCDKFKYHAPNALSESAIASRLRKMLSKVEELDFDTKAKVKMLVFFSHPVSAKYVKVLKGLGTLKLDNKRRITSFQETGWDWPIDVIHRDSWGKASPKTSKRVMIGGQKPQKQSIKKNNQQKTDNTTPIVRKPLTARELAFNPIEIPPHERSAQKPATKRVEPQSEDDIIYLDDDVLSLSSATEEQSDDDVICLDDFNPSSSSTPQSHINVLQNRPSLPGIPVYSILTVLKRFALFIDGFGSADVESLRKEISKAIRQYNRSDSVISVDDITVAIDENSQFIWDRKNQPSSRKTSVDQYLGALKNFVSLFKSPNLEVASDNVETLIEINERNGDATISEAAINNGLFALFHAIVGYQM